MRGLLPSQNSAVDFPFPKPSRRLVVRLLGALVFVFALLHTTAGIRWSRYFHPDEIRVARWITQSRLHGYVTDRVYPGGWFVIADAGLALKRRGRILLDRLAARGRQEGAVAAVRPDTFPNESAPAPLSSDHLQYGRNLNALLFAACAPLLFLAALETGASPAAAALAALLFAVQPFPLEHAHYCETDSAPLLFLCLSGWLALGALRRGSVRRALAASAAAGFAIACKYTLAPLVLWTPVLALALALRAPERRGRTFAAAAAGGLACLAAGFLAGTPALLVAPLWFLRDGARVSGATYDEIRLAFGFRPSFPAACLWRAGSLAREAGSLGAATLALFAVCAAGWFRRRERRWLAVFPLFSATFLLHCILAMPWIRNQELLPFLPALCLAAAPTLDLALAALRRGVPATRKAAAAAFLALFACSMADSWLDGNRILSCFRRRDTRAECQNWLAACAAPGVGIDADRYVWQALVGTDLPCLRDNGIAEFWPEALARPELASGGIRYALRNASFRPRNARRDNAGRNAAMARFEADCLPIAAWKIAPGGSRTRPFAQPDIELWALPPTNAAPPSADLPFVLDRPLFFSPGRRPLYAPEERAPGVGPVRAIATVGQRHAVHPPPAPGPLWAVSRVLAGPTEGSVAWDDGLFRPRRAAFAGAPAVLFELDRAAFRRCAASDVRPFSRLRLRDADDQKTVCATVLSSDPAEVAHALRRGGAPARALAFLRARTDLDDAARIEAFLAARAAGAPAEPGWTAAARAALAAFDAAEAAAAGGSGAEPAVRGVPLRTLRDFARVRIPRGPLPAKTALPVFLPAGRYRVEVLLDAAYPPVETDRWFHGQEGPVAETDDEQGREIRVASVRLHRDRFLGSRLLDPDPEGERIRFLRIEVEWNPADSLRHAADELRAALAAADAPAA